MRPRTLPDDPISGWNDPNIRLGPGNNCLTKREYFAAMILQGLMSDRTHIEFLSAGNPKSTDFEIRMGLAIAATWQADALIAALDADLSPKEEKAAE